MSAEPGREFVDANVLVYAFDASAGQKKSPPNNCSHDSGKQVLDASACRFCKSSSSR